MLQMRAVRHSATAVESSCRAPVILMIYASRQHADAVFTHIFVTLF